jgi:hypothetical protein
METKVCKACGSAKPLTDFQSYPNYPSCLMGICRDCKRAKDNEYSRRRNDRDREKVRDRNKAWVEKNRDRVLESKRVYNREHKDELIAKAKVCRSRKPDQYRETARKNAVARRAVDIDFRLKDVLRKRMRNALLGHSKAEKTMGLLGCSMDELKAHLASQFRNGMDWSNYGKNGWHIDHIKPCCSFDLTVGEEQRKCFHFTNLQPLWAKENWMKGALDRQQKVA